jgi:serine/threonine-protein kinase
MSKPPDAPATPGPTMDLLGPRADGGIRVPEGIEELGAVVPSSIPPDFFTEDPAKRQRALPTKGRVPKPEPAAVASNARLPHPPPMKPPSVPRMAAVKPPSVPRMAAVQAPSAPRAAAMKSVGTLPFPVFPALGAAPGVRTPPVAIAQKKPPSVAPDEPDAPTIPAPARAAPAPEPVLPPPARAPVLAEALTPALEPVEARTIPAPAKPEATNDLPVFADPSDALEITKTAPTSLGALVTSIREQAPAPAAAPAPVAASVESPAAGEASPEPDDLVVAGLPKPRRRRALALLAVPAILVAIFAARGVLSRSAPPAVRSSSAVVTSSPVTAMAVAPPTAVSVPDPEPEAQTPAEPAATTDSVAPPTDTGLLKTSGAVAGKRIFVDDKTVGETPASVPVKCGSHRVRIGSAGRSATIDVPCGGEVSVGDR